MLIIVSSLEDGMKLESHVHSDEGELLRSDHQCHLLKGLIWTKESWLCGRKIRRSQPSLGPLPFNGLICYN